MTDEDLKINTLHRFKKHSDNLVLEVFSHCEVPAGCGGAVLRWRNPNEGLPCTFWGLCSGKSEVFIDGNRLDSPNVLLQAGPHILAIYLRELVSDERVFMFVGDMNVPEEGSYPPMIDGTETRDDESWVYTSEQPDSEAWKVADFDSSQWSALDLASSDEKKKQFTDWRYEDLEKRGVNPLRLPGSFEHIWIRKNFEIPQSLLTPPVEADES